MKRLLFYRRVSTGEQAENGHSLDIQPNRAAAWCEAQGFTLVDVITDAGVSAFKVPFAQRDGGKEVKHRLLAGDADGLLVTRFDRIFRIATDGLMEADWFVKRNYHCLSIDLPIDISTTSGWRIFATECVNAEADRRLIADRARETSAGLRAQGKAWGPTPFGCVRVGDRIYRDPMTWDVREQIVAMRDEMSYRQMVSALKADDIPAPGGFSRGGKQRGGVMWHISTLKRIVDDHSQLQDIPELSSYLDTPVSDGGDHG